jgi:hypothetical protein
MTTNPTIAEPLQWPPPYSDIDDGIVEVVRAFNVAGFVTLSSCSGHGVRPPQVITRWRQHPRYLEALFSWLRANGLANCSVATEAMVMPSGVHNWMVRVQWWTPEALDEWHHRRDEEEEA